MRQIVRQNLLAFLDEDLGRGDVTSRAIVPPESRARGVVTAREAGLVCGLLEASVLCELVDVGCALIRTEGTPCAPGDSVLELEGPSRALLGVERTLLNLLGHMSGVATATRRAVDAVGADGPRIAATRKTLPGLRRLQKRAVEIGGGDPHRTDLSTAIMIKDNHLAVVDDPKVAVERARKGASFAVKVEIEVESLAAALEAAGAGADIVLLDNMDPQTIRSVVSALQEAGLRDRVLVEASGGITMENLVEYADTGVDVVSMGSLTSSVAALDFSLEIEPV